MIGRLVVWALSVWLVGGCGGGPQSPVVSEGPHLASLPPPTDPTRQHLEVFRAGRRILRALQRRKLQGALLGHDELKRITSGRRAAQLRGLRPKVFERELRLRPSFSLIRGARLSFVCVQGLRVEPLGTWLDLQSPAWVFDRVLLVVTSAAGPELGFWVEGTFVYTTRGFLGVHIRRLEAPRAKHAAVEISTCDMREGGPVHDHTHM